MFVRALLLICTAGALDAQVTFDRLLRADKEPQNWLTYSGSMLGQRYSPLTQVTPANVNNLQLQWAFQARSLEKFESTPLLIDGMMYLTLAPNDVVALDTASGDERNNWSSCFISATARGRIKDRTLCEFASERNVYLLSTSANASLATRKLSTPAGMPQ